VSARGASAFGRSAFGRANREKVEPLIYGGCCGRPGDTVRPSSDGASPYLKRVRGNSFDNRGCSMINLFFQID